MVISYKKIIPLQKETQVPYKICSYDIEADSSHGDFPLPIKSYEKLTSNIIDIHEKGSYKNVEDIKTLISRAILTAFGYDELKYIDTIHPIKHPKIDYLKKQINLLLQYIIDDKINKTIKHSTIGSLFNNYMIDDDDDDNIHDNDRKKRSTNIKNMNISEKMNY